MEWNDEGIVLSARRHGEGSAVVVLMTREHGRHAGLARGATSARSRAMLQPGNSVEAVWRARLAEHLGNWALEPLEGAAAELMDDPLKLAGLTSACAITDKALPEREPHPRVHAGLMALLSAMRNEDLGDLWVAAYVRWELGLLADLGFGLDLETCASTGATEDLVYVSPRSARAVSAQAGEPYHGKLLTLPRFLSKRGGGEPADMLDGLILTGHFLESHVFGAHGQPVPEPRQRFVERCRTQIPA
ncbi:MAG: DNA repair protein RecO [Rhodospirillaceae bacterium]|jgi:DNA repair protein RecO (recombination protein O)|nr:DNA repair protein RecO [Rhodospirillaceae bacterium]